MKESLVNKDSNNTEERNSKRRKKVSMIIKEQLYDIIEQNKISVLISRDTVIKLIKILITIKN